MTLIPTLPLSYHKALRDSDNSEGQTMSNKADIVSRCSELFSELSDMPLDERVTAINELRRMLHDFSPFKAEPVDLIQWVPNTSVIANDYNPNSVAPPEMELLRLSIMADGYTQPIVTHEHDGTLEVVDGFHRNRVGKECDDVRDRVHSYLPVVVINADRADKADRMAATIRHNRARGKHKVQAMSDIVLDLKRRNWTDKKIAKNLGMDEDEVLRLCQISGLADAFSNETFSRAWTADFSSPEEQQKLDEGLIDDDVDTV